MATGTIHNTMQQVIDTGISDFHAMKTGKLVTLYTHGNGFPISLDGIALPSSLWPKYTIKAYIPCYTTNWSSCRLEISSADGKMKAWSASNQIAVTYAAFSVTYELANP